jgi:uncharacterized protein (TIGR04255 family)
MGQQMKNAPVYFTIAQVRFNPVLSLSTFIPAIQESFRKRRYPDFKKAVAFTFNFALPAVAESEAPIPPPRPLERYIFSDTDNTENFLLDESSLSFQATKYETFEKFSAQLLESLDFVHQSVGGLSYIDRIGVRYLDAVRPREGEKLDQYLIPEVTGLYGKLSGQIHHAFSETLVTDNDGSLVSRAVIQEGQIGLPPDLLMNGLKIAKPFSEYHNLHAVLDTDAFYPERSSFDLGEIRRRLAILHGKTSVAFYSSVTPYALSTWA